VGSAGLGCFKPDQEITSFSVGVYFGGLAGSGRWIVASPGVGRFAQSILAVVLVAVVLAGSGVRRCGQSAEHMRLDRSLPKIKLPLALAV